MQETFAATGIDDALDLMEVVNAKSDKAGTGAAAANLEKHPERRFKVRWRIVLRICAKCLIRESQKASLEAYTERELPKLKEDVSIPIAYPQFFTNAP